jgi:DUF3040 family protein
MAGGANRERAMMTKQERRTLREIERGLYATDPRLVMLMSGGTYRQAPASRRAMVVLVDLLALAMIALAAATGTWALVFVSMLVTLLAMSLHVVRRRARTV